MGCNDPSVLSIIWEESADRELCVVLPVVGRKCVRLRTRVRLVLKGADVVVETEAFGKRWCCPLESGRHLLIQWGTGELRLCLQSLARRARLVLEGCIVLGGTARCVPLLSKEVRFVRISELTEGELMILGFADPSIKGFNLNTQADLGAIASDLTTAELRSVLKQETPVVSGSYVSAGAEMP